MIDSHNNHSPGDPEQKPRAAVLVLSDSASEGKRRDLSGRHIVDSLQELGCRVEDYRVQSDDEDGMVERLQVYAVESRLDLVITTGGTGLGPRDRAPEALLRVIDREVPGIAEVLRIEGGKHTPFAALSRGRAGLRGRTLIINLPGSLKAVKESIDLLSPLLFHAFAMVRGEGHEGSAAS